MESLKLERDRAVVLVVDVQERLLAAMPEGARAPLLRATQALVEGAKQLKVPVLATEQYPKGLGPTVPALRDALPGAPHEKLDFSCAAVPAVKDALGSGPRQVVLCGMETHVCVFQTARDLAALGHQVFVAEDAVASRTEANRRVGLSLMERGGAIVTSTEAVLFDLLGRAGTPEFKAVSALVK